MKITIITCYESNEERVAFIFDACKKMKYDVNVITTDFSHIKKQKRSIQKDDYIYLNTLPYSKNLSYKRIKSHIKFAKDAFAIVENNIPDLIWLMVPANSLLKRANEFKKSHSEVKLTVDFIDMWPESLPISINKNILPFKLWKKIRSDNIACADLVVSECDYYHDVLKTEYSGMIKTIRWCKDKKINISKLAIDNSVLRLAYIGSINNIISTSLIARVIDSIDMPVELHIVGEGENRYSFINELRKHCEVIYHGATRDEKEIAKIFSVCHAGLNLYKEDLYIGLTVKCLDYLSNGLPIINNIKGDTWNMVDTYKLGINYANENVIDAKAIIKQRKNYKNIISFYQNNFTKKVFIDNCTDAIKQVMK